MKVKVVQGLSWFSDELSEEEKESARTRFKEIGQGIAQQKSGEISEALADSLLEMFTPDSQEFLEAEIQKLHGVKSYDRFKTKYLTLLYEILLGLGDLEPIQKRTFGT